MQKKTKEKKDYNALKEYAFLLYKDGSFTQKTIAEKVGVAERTISDWKRDDDWERKVKSIKQTREENLMSLHEQWSKLNEYIKNEQQGIPDSGQADTIRKLVASIRDLENEVGYTEAYQVLKKMILHIQKLDHDKGKEMMDYVDSFMQELLKYEL